eukprot:scaffold1277_cov253-Pinguiococcus_pyrenoidosus.AAC.24
MEWQLRRSLQRCSHWLEASWRLNVKTFPIRDFIPGSDILNFPQVVALVVHVDSVGKRNQLSGSAPKALQAGADRMAPAARSRGNKRPRSDGRGRSMRNLLLKMTPALAAKLRQAMKAEDDESFTVVVEAGDPPESKGAQDDDSPAAAARPDQRLYFVLGGERYPAALVNLPCNVEAMKSFNCQTYFKSSDIGQALIVYESEEERDLDMKICETLDLSSNGGRDPEGKPASRRVKKDRRYYHSGLTPPSLDVVRRRFWKTKYWEADRQNLDRDEVRAVCLELEQFLPPVRRGRKPGEPLLSETVYETVIDFGELLGSATSMARRVRESEAGTDAEASTDAIDVPLETLLENYPAFARYLLSAETCREVEEEVREQQTPVVQKEAPPKSPGPPSPAPPAEPLPQDEPSREAQIDGLMAKGVDEDILFDNDDLNMDILGFDFEQDDLIVSELPD